MAIGIALQALRAFFAGLVKTFILKPLATAFSVMVMWAFHALNRLVPRQAVKLAREISDMYYVMPEEWAGFVAQYLERMTGRPVEIEKLISQGAGIGAREFMEEIGEAFLTPMLGLIMPEPAPGGGISPKAGIDSAERYLAANAQFQLSAWLLHVIGDFVSFGMFKSLKDLPNAISWSYGLGWLSWLIMGTPFRIATTDPMEQFFNRIYRPARLTPTQLMKAYRADLITREEFLEQMARHGYTDDAIEDLYQMEEKDLSDADIRLFLQMGWMSIEDAVKELKARGYSEDRARFLAQLEARRRALSLIEDLVDEASKRFQEGVISREDLRRYLGLLNYSPEEEELLVGLLELKARRRRELTPAQLRDLYEKEIIGLADFRERLLELGYTERDADLLIEQARR